MYGILEHWREECGPHCCSVYESICRVEGFGLPLAKGCDIIVALTPCKQKCPLKVSVIMSLEDICFMA